ncbi:hypothetical protein [Amycolatopsis sp. NPDC003731]
MATLLFIGGNMAREFQVQIDRSTRGADQAFPQWEKLEKVTRVETNVGRDYESDEIWAGTADIEFEFNSEDTIYATDDTVDLVDDSYGNGFSYICSDYFDVVAGDEDSKLRLVNGVLQYNSGKGAVYTAAPVDGANTSYDWRFNFDSMYAAIVKPGGSYVVAMVVEELNYNGTAPAATEHAKVHWWSDAGVLLQVDEFFSATIATTGQTQIKGKVTAPSTAYYVTLGSTPTGVSATTRYFKYSKFQIHKYDAAYEAANGGNYLKPFVIDNLRTTAPQAGTKVRLVSPGNQFDINRWYPKALLGTNVGRRDGNVYNVMPNAYAFDTMTTVSDFFTATNATLSLLTSGVISGTKSLNIATTATSPATITVGALSTTYAIPVDPGKTYAFGFLAYNAIATACSVTVTANFAGGGSASLGTNVIAASAPIGYVGWTLSVPAGVYGVQLVLSITGGVRNIVIDEMSLTTNNLEPDPYTNKLSYLGDFESITSLTIAKYVSSSTSSAFSVVMDRNNAHSGNRCLKLTKANAVTTANVRFGATSNVFPVYTEANNTQATAGVPYVFTYWAKASAANANTKIQTLYKSNLAQSVVTSGTLRALTTSWQQYKETIIIAPGATALHLGIQVVADASPAIDIYIDDLDVRRFTGGFRSDLSSVTANSRISYYDVDTMQAGQAIMHYGNDSLDDGGRSYKTYHSGTTRTRFKVTIKSLGSQWDMPVGTTASVSFSSISGRILGSPNSPKSGYFGGAFAGDISAPITLPTNGGSVTVDLLGPDVPFCAQVPIIFMNVPRGAYTVGYEFIGEYIGPDGYQASPGVKEASLLTGVVEVRDDSIESMSTDGQNRSITRVKLGCTDTFGQLGSVKLDSPYKQTVLNDDPLIYLPLDDSLDAIGNLSDRLDVDFYVRTQGVPNNWGVSEDGTTNLAEEGGSLRFENPPLTGLGATQGQVIYGQFDGTLIDRYEGSYEIWFQRDTTAPDMIDNPLFNHNFAADKSGKIYVWMAGSQLWYKWGQVPGSYQIVDIGEARHDGKPHHVAMTKDKNGLVRCYFDGSQVASFTSTDRNVNQMIVGGGIPETYQFYAGNLGHFAWYDRCLPGYAINNHWLAGIDNRPTTNEVARIKYILQSAKQPGILPILHTRNGDMSTGLSTLNPASWNSGTTPADLIVSASKSADGIVWAGGDGSFIYENKQSRFNYGKTQNNAKWLISTGDNSIQPEGDYGAKTDITKIVNSVRVSGKFNGSEKATTFPVGDRLSQRSYSKVGKDFNTEQYDADEARQTASWDVKTHNKPVTRYKTLTFVNQANDATDDFCRRVQPGDYLYGDIVNKNGLGGGSLNHFVERVKHYLTPKADGTALWQTDIEISPAYNQLAWIVEDPVYGNLDGKNRLAY